MNQKINDEILKKNVDKCVSLAGSAEFKLLSLDDSKFKLKNHTLEYVGSIPLLPDSRRESSINDGKVSYEFAEAVCSQLQNQILTLREINVLSDIFRFDLLSVINAEQLTIPEG